MPYNKEADKYYPATGEQEMNSFAQHTAMADAINKLLVLTNGLLFERLTIEQLWLAVVSNVAVDNYVNMHPGDIAIYRKQLVRNYLRDKIAAYLNTLE